MTQREERGRRGKEREREIRKERESKWEGGKRGRKGGEGGQASGRNPRLCQDRHTSGRWTVGHPGRIVDNTSILYKHVYSSYMYDNIYNVHTRARAHTHIISAEHTHASFPQNTHKNTHIPFEGACIIRPLYVVTSHQDSPASIDADVGALGYGEGPAMHGEFTQRPGTQIGRQRLSR